MNDSFIKSTDQYTTQEQSIPAPYIRKSFILDKSVKAAKIQICTPGFYELYLNGENITKGFLAPYISNPDDMVCFDEYDVSEKLRLGNNAIGVILGNGFANQTVKSWNFCDAPFRAPLCVSVEMCATLSDGSEYKILSDESFKTHPSPVIYDMYRYGTHYDARLEIEGWADADFDDSSWQNVSKAISPKGKIRYCFAEPITAQEEIGVVSMSEKHDFCYLKTKLFGGDDVEFSRVEKGYLYDFGVCKSGVCRLKIRGKRGQKITLRHGERTTEEGNFNVNSIYTFKTDYADYIHLLQTDVYILKGGEEEIFLPPFTYHAFRYVLVEGLEEDQATKELLTFVVFNSNIAQKASFKCSDETLNTIYEMTLNADRSNFHYFPTDCPHREKNGWTGDASISAEQFAAFFDCERSLMLWLESMRYAQSANGRLPGIVPTTGWGYAFGNGPAWDAACVNIPYYLYVYNNNTEVIAENADMISKYLHCVDGMIREDGLIAFGLGDWCQPKREEIGILSPQKLTDTLTIFDISKKAAFLFEIISRDDDAKFALALAEKLRGSIRKELIDYERMVAEGDCQTSQALLLALGIFEESERDAAYSNLIEMIHRDGDYMMTGVIGYKPLFEQLILNGDVDLALKMICREDEPSYAAMIARGATALCEAFDKNGVQESENHHFFGDIIRIFMNYLAGIKLSRDISGTPSIKISPVIPLMLTYAKGEITTEFGEVSAGWEKKGDKLRFYAEVPEGIACTFEFNGTVKTLSSGHNEIAF